jgi:cysteine desulfurase
VQGQILLFREDGHRTVKLIYADHNATSPMTPEHLRAVTQMLAQECVGNPSSVHRAGRRARLLLEDARDAVAGALGAAAKDVTFTSGATEANARALEVFVEGFWIEHRRPPHILCGAGDHASTMIAIERLVAKGMATAQNIALTLQGIYDTSSLFEAIGSRTPDYVAILHVNGETGALNPLADLIQIIRAHCPAAHIHGDLVQSFGKIPVSVERWDLDTAAVSGHKLGSVPGIGAFYKKSTITIPPLLNGGGQERGLRSGTQNLLGAVSFGLITAQLDLTWLTRFQPAANKLRQGILSLPGSVLHSDPQVALAHTTNASFASRSNAETLLALDLAGIAAANGSACSSGTTKPSHVLRAMGVDEECAMRALRFSFGAASREEDVDGLLQALYNLSK